MRPGIRRALHLRVRDRDRGLRPAEAGARSLVSMRGRRRRAGSHSGHRRGACRDALRAFEARPGGFDRRAGMARGGVSGALGALRRASRRTRRGSPDRDDLPGCVRRRRRMRQWIGDAYVGCDHRSRQVAIPPTCGQIPPIGTGCPSCPRARRATTASRRPNGGGSRCAARGIAGDRKSDLGPPASPHPGPNLVASGPGTPCVRRGEPSGPHGAEEPRSIDGGGPTPKRARRTPPRRRPARSETRRR